MDDHDDKLRELNMAYKTADSQMQESLQNTSRMLET